MQPIEEQKVRIPVEEGSAVSAVMAVPASFRSGKTNCVILAHGAGTDMHHPLVSFFHRALAQRGWLTVKFNFPLGKWAGRRLTRPKNWNGPTVR